MSKPADTINGCVKPSITKKTVTGIVENEVKSGSLQLEGHANSKIMSLSFVEPISIGSACSIGGLINVPSGMET